MDDYQTNQGDLTGDDSFIPSAPTQSNHSSERSDVARPQISSDQLKEFIRFIVSNMVTQSDQVDISVSEDIPGQTTIHIKVAQEDKGRVIGKSGSTINAIRTLVRVFGRIVVLVQD